jgi:ferrous-iron efflux pump FieF
MDEELSQDKREKIKAIVLRQPDARGFHDMRTRSDGDRVFIELHVEMDGNKTLREAHALAEKIMTEIMAEFPNADVLVHQDPADAEEFRLDTQIETSPKRR